MKKILSLVLAVMMLLSGAAFAEGLEMSDVPGMTASGVLPIVTEPTQLEVAIPQHTLVLDYEDNYLTKLVESETGIDIVFNLLPSAETATKVDLMMASGDELPDVFLYGFGAQTASYGEQGYFHVLNDYFDKENGYAGFFWNAEGMTEQDYTDYFARSTEADGNMYAFSFLTRGSGDIPRISPYVNMNYLKALGLEKPTNKEELYDMLVAFRDNDPNGNGEKDEIPMIGANWNGGDDEMLINMFTYWNPDYMLNVENDVVYAPFVTDEWQEAMIYLNKLYTEGLLSNQTFTITGDELVALTQGYGPEEQKIGVLVGMFTVTIPDSTNPAALAYDIIEPFDGQYTPMRTANITKYGYITTDCEIPEIAFRFMDFFTQQRVSLITRYGEPGVHWMYRPDDPDAYDAYFVGGQAPRAKMLGHEAIQGQIAGVTSPWSTQNNAIWNTHTCCLLPEATYGGTGTTSTTAINSWEEGVATGDIAGYRNYISVQHQLWRGVQPAQVFTDPVYSVAEMDATNDTITTLRSYVNESIAAFASGQMDPVNDWETYKANLESAGLQQWIDVAQAYWTRSH